MEHNIEGGIGASRPLASEALVEEGMYSHGRSIGLLRALVCVGLLTPALVLPASALDDADRDARLQPERVMDTIGIRPGMVVGEAGAGRGLLHLQARATRRRLGQGLRQRHRPGRPRARPASLPERGCSQHLVALFRESGYELAGDEHFLERDLLLIFRPS